MRTALTLFLTLVMFPSVARGQESTASGFPVWWGEYEDLHLASRADLWGDFVELARVTEEGTEQERDALRKRYESLPADSPLQRLFAAVFFRRQIRVDVGKLSPVLESDPLDVAGAVRRWREIREPFRQASSSSLGDRITVQESWPQYFADLRELVLAEEGGGPDRLLEYYWGGKCGTGRESLEEPRAWSLFLRHLRGNQPELSVGALFEVRFPDVTFLGEPARFGVAEENDWRWRARFLEHCGMDWEMLYLGAILDEQEDDLVTAPLVGQLAAYGSVQARERLLAVARDRSGDGRLIDRVLRRLANANNESVEPQNLAELRWLDIRDLLQFDHRVVPRGRSVVEELRLRCSDRIALQERQGVVLFQGDDDVLQTVWNAIASIRHEAGSREVGRAREALSSLVRDYDGGEYGGCYIKFTWTGPESKPVPGLAIHSTTRIFDVTPFRAFRRKGIHYGNDDLPVFRSFAALPERMGDLVRAIVETPAVQEMATRTDPRLVSVSIVDTWSGRRPNYVELLLDAGETGTILRRMEDVLRDGEVTARQVIAEYLATMDR